MPPSVFNAIIPVAPYIPSDLLLIDLLHLYFGTEVNEYSFRQVHVEISDLIRFSSALTYHHDRRHVANQRAYSPPLALTVISSISIGVAAVVALWISLDIIWRRGWKSMMAVMYVQGIPVLSDALRCTSKLTSRWDH